MINLKYSITIEATEDPTFFTFYSPDIEGFTGVGHSIEDCIYQQGFFAPFTTIYGKIY